MSFPRTLGGIFAFVLFVGFLGAIVTTNSYQDNFATGTMDAMHEATERAYNTSDTDIGVFSQLSVGLTMGLGIMGLTLNSMLAFGDMIVDLPAIMYIIYPILTIMFIMAVVHVIMWGER